MRRSHSESSIERMAAFRGQNARPRCFHVRASRLWPGDAHSQSGYTLIEMVVAMAVVGIVMAAASYSIAQVFNTNTRNTNYMVAVRNAQTAGYWTSRVVQMADPQTIQTDNSTFLSLVWRDSDNITAAHTDTLSLEGSTLWRMTDGQKTRVADNIESIHFGWDDAAMKLRFDVTSSVTTRGIVGTETRRYEISPRPGVQ